jgi:hypothetical protein
MGQSFQAGTFWKMAGALGSYFVVRRVTLIVERLGIPS